MKKISLFFLLTTCISAFAANDFQNKLDRLVDASVQADAFSGNILIARHDSIIYKRSAGFADWEKRTALNDSTLFNIGSIGKDFTQVLMIQLYAAQKLNFDDPLNKYLSIFPDSIAKKITLRMLLRMESGLGDYHDRPFRNLQERLAYIKTLPMLFEPGTGQEYSNSGYVVLAAVIEKVSGQSYEENVRNRIFLPLGMMHSEFIFPGKMIANKAVGTDIDPAGNKMTEHMINDELTPSGDGSEYSTTSDLLKFYSSLMHDQRLLSDELKEFFFQRFDLKPKHTLNELKSSPNAIMGYAGGLNGWNACVDVYFGLDQVVISLCNLSDMDRPAEEMNHRIVQLVRSGEYDAPKQPRFVFAYSKYKSLGVNDFTEKINSLLKANNYEQIQGPYFFNQIGKCLLRENRNDDAVTVLLKNTKLFPMAPMAWLLLGKSYDAAGKKEEAKKAIAKCLELDPGNREASELLGSLK